MRNETEIISIIHNIFNEINTSVEVKSIGTYSNVKLLLLAIMEVKKESKISFNDFDSVKNILKIYKINVDEIVLTYEDNVKIFFKLECEL